MKIVENVTQDGGVVTLDDTLFINCKFTNCTVVITGEEFQALNSSWIGCALIFTGAARHVVSTLQFFGWGPPKPDSAIVKPTLM